MNGDDTNIFQWTVSILYGIGASLMGLLYLKTNQIDKAFVAHVLLVEQTYAKNQEMRDGFKVVNTKLDDTQKAVNEVAKEQARQGENIKNMGDNLKTIAEGLKDKA